MSVPLALQEAVELADRALSEHRGCIAFSGGVDSSILVDLVHRFTSHRPPLLFADSGLESAETRQHVQEFATRYGARLMIAVPKVTPEETWAKSGLPLIGKMAGPTWEQSHRGMGFRVSCSSCCKARKIQPARRLMRAEGFDLQLTGLRGDADSASRGMRAAKDGTYYLHQADRVWIANPLSSWSDMKGRCYVKKYGVPMHPAVLAGHQSPGCIPCGGGAMFAGSNLRTMRLRYPEAWRKYIPILGPAVLAVKYGSPLSVIQRVLERLGGIERVMVEKPFLFDFLRARPLESYRR